ncbi:MAG: CDP-archaeol synthase [Thermoplasmata archaeon]|nr:CDP-archaeol synthase [Thermoplasmata archaeon]MCI4340956.1 CDP-archaeol synthase [Thermoplasmata archaeon]
MANATATLPKGRGPAMDFGRRWARDGRRILGPSKTWSGFWMGTLFPLPFGLLEQWLIMIAPPPWKLVPAFSNSLLGAVPVILLLSGGALCGDALGSFFKRRRNIPSGSRALLLDQLGFVLLPVTVGLLAFPGVFWAAFGSLEALAWLLVFTLGLHVAFNYIGYWTGLKKVPW